ncbi:MAG TPA: extracellular solute-binding protein [Chloroflexota bacterium]
MSIGRPTSRRAFVRLTVLGGTAALLAACGASPAPTETPAAPPKAAAPAEAAKPTEPAKPAEAPKAAAEPTKPAAAAPAPTKPAAAAPAAPGKKQKISISHIGGGSLEGSEKSDRMKQLRANFPDLDIENRWISYAAYVDKISVMTATGDLADLQFCNAFNDVPLMMDNNLLLETGPLLEKSGKNIVAATPKDAWDSTLYNGKQYAVAHNIYDLNIWGIFYRKDWLDKLGAKIPETTEQYADLLKAMTSKDPSGGVVKGTYGRVYFTSIKFDDDLFHAFDVAVGHHANGFWREREGKLALDWVHPNMKEAWGWLQARWAEKVIDPDSMTAQITYWGQPWSAAKIGTQYMAWTAIDGQKLEMRKTDPKADIVGGPALKGPQGHSGFTGEGFPWVYVIPQKSQVAETAVRVVDWFFEPKQAARFTCEGELGYTLKSLNDKGYCVEYTLDERQAMGAQWAEKNNAAQDISAYGGLWLPLGGTAVRPWLLNTMPSDMKAHFENVLKGRYSPAALQAGDYVAKYTKTTKKKRPTKSEKQYWPGLQSRFLELMTQSVAGTIPLEQGWKEWLSFFEKNGGPTLTQEVNELK